VSKPGDCAEDGAVATAILLLCCAPYAAVAVGYLEARRRGERPPRWARVLGAATVAIHLGALVALGAKTGRSPFQTESQALSFLAFSLGALYLLLEATSRVAAHGGGFWLLTAILSGCAVPGLSREAVGPPRAPDAVLSFHVGFALLGTATILAGGLLAAGYLGAYRRIKDREIAPVGGDAGPSLFGLQVLSRHASAAGLLLLGPSLVLGWIALVRRDAESPWARVALASSALEFVVVLVAAFLWWRRPKRGAVAAWLNVTATAIAVLTIGVVHPLLTRAAGAT
jgi:hypothetical protein